MTLEQVKLLITQLDLDDVVKEGRAISEPVLCLIDGKWIDVYFTYAISYISNTVTNPIELFGINSSQNEVVFKKKINHSIERIPFIDFDVSVYDAYAKSYENARYELFNETNNREIIQEYILLLKQYVGESLWKYYESLLSDLMKL